MIQRVDGSIHNPPNNTIENLENAAMNAKKEEWVNGKPYEEMTPAERAEYNAWKEENDQEFLKAVGRGSDDAINPSMLKGKYPRQVPTLGGDTTITIKPADILPGVVQPPREIARPSTIVPRPPINKPTLSSFGVSAIKDELTIPFSAVATFVTSVMGDDFGYISKEMAKSIIALIPKEAAILAIGTSKEDAMKFLDHDDPVIRKEAIKKYFNTSDEGVEVIEDLLATPGFEINPWKK